MPPVPHSRPALGEREAAAVAAVMASGHISQGEQVARLEAAVAHALGMEDGHGVALSSGTAALLVALRSLGIGPGDEVLIPAYACASLHQAVVYAGATPCHFDCDPFSLEPDAGDARRRMGAGAAACIVPHLFGRPANIEAFRELGLPLIEDCAQTLGVRRGGRLVGTSGDLTVCSFYATKLIAGAEGGMVLSRDDALIRRAREQRDCEDPGGHAGAFNFKLSDLHAAIAAVQLERLDEFLARRRELAGRYHEGLQHADVDLPPAVDDGEHAWFRFVVRLRSFTLEAVLGRCERHGIACRRPVGRLVEGLDLEDLPGSQEAWRKACSLPLYPALTEAEAEAVPQRFLEALEEPGE